MRLRYRELREDNDLTQADVAKHLECHQSDYSKYECGVHAMPMRNAIKLADLYHVNLDYLIGRTDVKEMLPPAAPYDIDE